VPEEPGTGFQALLYSTRGGSSHSQRVSVRRYAGAVELFDVSLVGGFVVFVLFGGGGVVAEVEGVGEAGAEGHDVGLSIPGGQEITRLRVLAGKSRGC
jgi:hypothetical protein